MDSNNVTQRTVMARYYPGGPGDLAGSDEDALRLAERYPGRFFPLVGMQRPLLTGSYKWQSPDHDVDRLIEETERKLASGRFFGIGEFIVRHWAYDRGPHAEQENPIYSTFMRRMSELSARFEVPMVVHMEGYPALVDDFSRLLVGYPNTRFIWAHNCGRSRAAVIRGMLARHSNLFCDLAGMTNVGTYSYGTGWPRMESFTALIEQDGVLVPDMKALYEEFPDRFMLGMDFAHARANNLRILLPARKSISRTPRATQTRNSQEVCRNECDSCVQAREHHCTLIAQLQVERTGRGRRVSSTVCAGPAVHQNVERPLPGSVQTTASRRLLLSLWVASSRSLIPKADAR